jgi:hypothetical protein
MADFPPSIKAYRLYKKTSAKGVVYFQGRMGNLKVVVLKSKDVADDGTEMWDVLYSQAPSQPRDASQSSYASPKPADPAKPAPSTYQDRINDEIPF